MPETARPLIVIGRRMMGSVMVLSVLGTLGTIIHIDRIGVFSLFFSRARTVDKHEWFLSFLNSLSIGFQGNAIDHFSHGASYLKATIY